MQVSNSTSKALVSLTSCEWFGPWRGRQHLLTRLAGQGMPVVFSNGIYTRWEVGTSWWKDAPWLGRFSEEHQVQVFHTPKFPLRWPQRFGRTDRWLMRQHIRQLRKRLPAGVKPVWCVHQSWFADYIPCFGSDPVIYYPFDAASPEYHKDSAIEVGEKALIKRADMILATTESIAELLPEDGATRARVLHNGAATQSLLAKADRPCPPFLNDIPQPRIGYTGVINRKLDYQLIATIARQRPDWHWVLVGPVHEFGPQADAGAAAALEWRKQAFALPNVHVMGRQDYPAFAECLHHMDVNVICNRRLSGWWQAAYPLKFHEYLAAGKPVVSSPVQALLPFADVAAFADGPEQWLSALEQALVEGGVGKPTERINVALANDWQQRVDQLMTWIEEL